MSLLDTFDPVSEEIIKAKKLVKNMCVDFPQTVVGLFSRKIFDYAAEMQSAEQIGELSSGFGSVPIYKINWNGRDVAVYLSMLGDAGAAGFMEEVIAQGGRKFLYLGSCGGLTPGVSAGHLILPQAAYRDEGTSYHYAPVSDFIEIEGAEKLAGIMDALEIPYLATKTWTTAAFYRETRDNAKKRVAAGCQVVEMECSALAAVAKFRGVEFAQILYGADSLAGEDWDKRILGGLSGDQRMKYLQIALDVAAKM